MCVCVRRVSYLPSWLSNILAITTTLMMMMLAGKQTGRTTEKEEEAHFFPNVGIIPIDKGRFFLLLELRLDWKRTSSCHIEKEKMCVSSTRLEDEEEEEASAAASAEEEQEQEDDDEGEKEKRESYA